MKIFDLELASPCNAKCDFCPQKFHGVKRERPFMDEAIVDRITGEIGEMARSEPVHVVLCGMGENLLRKPLVIRALDRLQQSGGRVTTGLVTNGSWLTEDLLEHESFRQLDTIQVSFTGHGKEAYEELFRLDYDRVVENVVRMNEKLPGKVYVYAVDLLRLRRSKDDFTEFWNDKGIRVMFGQLHSRGGHIDDAEAYPGKFRQFSGCEIFDLLTFISSDGLVLSCCHDVQSENVVGDCRVSTLAEILERKKELRRSEFPGYDICAKCTDFKFEAPPAAGEPVLT